MAKITQYSRISHHTLEGIGYSAVPFTIPSQEDFTDENNPWSETDLSESEIGVNVEDQKIYIRVGNTIKELQTTRTGNVSVDGQTIDYNSNQQLEVIGLPGSVTDGITIGINTAGQLEVIDGGGFVTDGITIDYNTSNELEVIGLPNNIQIPSGAVDGITIGLNMSGELYVIGGVGDTNVKSDWNESDNTSDSYIKNKPTLFSGNYNDLSNKPTIPTNNNQLTNGAGYVTTDTTYTADDGINIDGSNKIKAKVDGTSIGINTSNELEVIGLPNNIQIPSGAVDGTSIGINMSGELEVIGGGGGSMDITPITYSNLKTLKTNDSLEPGTRYFITDRDIWVDALDTDKLAMECKRHFRIVKTEHYTPHIDSVNNYLGIYGQTIQRGLVPNSDGSTIYYAIWGGRMWQRDNSGLDIPHGSSNVTIAVGWTMINESDDTHYKSKIFDIKYNFDDDIIWEQSDDRSNIIRRQNKVTSYIDITDWGSNKIDNNQCTGIFNNFNIGMINDNSNSGIISSNTSSVVSISYNSNKGGIQNNSNKGSISYNSNKGGIFNNSNNISIQGNTNNGSISGNSNFGHISGNSNGGDIYDNSNSGSIGGNSNTGTINDNTNSGSIGVNSNSGSINNNKNLSGTTHIRYNTNNGFISRNFMNGSYLLEYNTNNGNIGVPSGTVTRNADITDTQLNK